MKLQSPFCALFQTLSDEIRDGIDKVTPYFTNPNGFFHQGIVSVNWDSTFTKEIGSAYVIMGQYTFTKESGDKVQADYSYVLVNTDGELKIQSHHSSLTYR